MDEDVVLRIRLSREEYRRLQALAEEKGYHRVSDLVKDFLFGAIEGQSPGYGKSVAQEIRRLERRITDLLNPYTGKIDEVMRRLGEIQELLEECLEKGRPEPQVEPQQPRRAARQWQEDRQERPRRQQTAIDVLRQQKVTTLSDVKRMKMPHKLFEKLRREGAIVFRAGREMVAVDPDFWNEFLETLEKYSVRDPDELAVLLEGSLGDKAARLFRILVRTGLAFYDEDAGQWIVEVDTGETA